MYPFLFDGGVFAGETPGDFLFFIFGCKVRVLNECFANVFPLHQEHLIEGDLERASGRLERF